MKANFTEKIRILAKRKGLKIGELADRSGQSRQNLSNKMTRADWKESEMEAVAETMGYEIEVVLIDKETGERI